MSAWRSGRVVVTVLGAHWCMSSSVAYAQDPNTGKSQQTVDLGAGGQTGVHY